MEDHNDLSDTSDSIDQQDLEFALYSQIHFDTSLESAASFPAQKGSATPSYYAPSSFFCLGLEELEKDNLKSHTDQWNLPSVYSETRAASSKSSRKEDVLNSSTFFIDKAPGLGRSQTKEKADEKKVKEEQKGLSHADISQSNVTSAKGKSKKVLKEKNKKESERTTNEINTDKFKIKIKAESSESDSDQDKEKKDQPLLKYVVTKTKSQTLPTKDTNQSTEDGYEQTKSKSKAKKDNTEKVQGKGENKRSDKEFILVSKKVTKQKIVNVTKQEVAVKPRNPPVRLRYPAKVNVQYRQDSDTDTDYSDTSSDCSTPKKKKKAKSSMPVCVESPKHKVPEKSQKVNKDTVQVKAPQQDDNESKNPPDQPHKVDDDDEESSHDDSYTDSDASSDEDSSSENSDDSGEDDIPSEGIDQNLDFNIAGGVESLLKGPQSSEADIDKDKWHIEDQDRYNVASVLSRYFSERKIQCRNCRQEGHMSRDCPQPLKKRCLFCAEEGHSYQVCPQSVCHNCGTPGHRVKDCPHPRQQRWKECARCWMMGHPQLVCPDRWRQYHLTTMRGQPYKPSEPSTNPTKWCYNCGKKGHLGFECREERMNRFVEASYPFIAEYDLKKKKSPHKHKDEKHRDEHDRPSRKRKKGKGKSKADSRSDSAHDSKSSKSKRRKYSKSGRSKESFEGEEPSTSGYSHEQVDHFGSFSQESEEVVGHGRNRSSQRQARAFQESGQDFHSFGHDHSGQRPHPNSRKSPKFRHKAPEQGRDKSSQRPERALEDSFPDWLAAVPSSFDVDSEYQGGFLRTRSEDFSFAPEQNPLSMRQSTSQRFRDDKHWSTRPAQESSHRDQHWKSKKKHKGREDSNPHHRDFEMEGSPGWPVMDPWGSSEAPSHSGYPHSWRDQPGRGNFGQDRYGGHSMDHPPDSSYHQPGRHGGPPFHSFHGRPGPSHSRSGPAQGRPGPSQERSGPYHEKSDPAHGRPGPSHGRQGPAHGRQGPAHPHRDQRHRKQNPSGFQSHHDLFVPSNKKGKKKVWKTQR